MTPTEKLRIIKAWCEAYPLDVFPEPDFKKVKQVLEDNDLSLDEVSASNMRHAFSGVERIIKEYETRIKLEPQYSGDCSKNFWRLVNALPEPEHQEMYFAGVLLQNMEDQILNVLDDYVNATEAEKL